MKYDFLGDRICVTLDNGATATYDSVKLARLRRGEQATYLAQIIAAAMDSVKVSIPAGPVQAAVAVRKVAVRKVAVRKEKPIPPCEDENGNYIPSGISQGED
jgi:hypothetical protein